ncbi:MAG: RsiV family protein [Treponema sp.]|nr:RsiV family protein [Treponema sp.]
MKFFINFFPLVVLNCLFLQNACTGVPGKMEAGGSLEGTVQGLVLYQLVTEEESIPLYPDRKDRSPRMTLQFTLLDASGSPAQRRFFRDVLYQGNNPEEYKEKILRSYEREYFKMRPAVARYEDFPQESLNWFYVETMETEAISSRGAVVRRSREYYTGGAHGMRNTEYFVLDLKSAERFSLEDIISPGSEPALKAEVAAALRDFSNLKAGEPLSQGYYFEDTVAPSRNFFLNSRGLGFHWDPYEIAPYATGSIEIVIPYNRITQFLNVRTLSLIEDLN